MAFWGLFGGSRGANKRVPGVQSGEAASHSGSAATTVNQDTALNLSAFWACVKLISESVASMPLVFYEKQPDGTRKPLPDYPLAQLFGAKVNRYQTRFGFFETLTMNLCMQGNAYALIQRGSGDKIIGLLPLMSSQMLPELQKNGDITYTYDNGSTQTVIPAKDIWHIRLMGNGVVGLSPISYARNSIAIGLAADNTTSKVFKNDGKPAAALELPEAVGKLLPDQRKQLKQAFKEIANDGEDNLFLLEMGMKYKQVSMTPADIELLSSRSFQLKDVARFMGVPSVLINDADSTTVWGSGISQIVEGFYKFGLRPYLERYEASIITDLCPVGDRRRIECEFDFNALLRANLKERMEIGKAAVAGALMTPNQFRATEGWGPEEGGDHLYMQQQMYPLSKLADAGRDVNGRSRSDPSTA